MRGSREKRKKIDVVRRYDTGEAESMVRSVSGRRLYPLRINAITVIYVPEEKNNEAYAEEYRRRLGLGK